jgi:hypothetical protein
LLLPIFLHYSFQAFVANDKVTVSAFTKLLAKEAVQFVHLPFWYKIQPFEQNIWS